MEQVKLGRTNLKVSRLSLGALCFGDPAWRPYVVDEAASQAIIRRALDHGINLIDTSNYYSFGRSEEVVGRAWRDLVRRDDIILATKVGNPMREAANAGSFSRKNIFAAVEASLRRLNTDHIDIYQTHIWKEDGIDLDEVVDAFDDLVRQGKILYPGVTVMPVWQFVSCVISARHTRRTPFATVSNHYNLLWREDERELLPFCRSGGIGVIAHSPHARGVLCGSARRTPGTQTVRATTDEYAALCYQQPHDFAMADLVEQIAGERGVKPSQIALAWVLSKPGIHSVLFGATRPEHVDDAAAALGIRLSAEECERLESPYIHRPPDAG
jgi:aryl-alcohol dehydrogenase-like predicted oxidoreductase